MKNKVFNKKSIVKTLFYLFLLFPFYEIPYVTLTFPFLGTIFKYWKILSFIIILLYYLWNKKVSKIILLVALYVLILGLSTCLNSGDLYYFFNLSLSLITLCLIFDYGINHDSNLVLEVAVKLLTTLLVLNLVAIIIYPNGMYTATDTLYTENWLLGYRNSLILYIFPALLCSFINSLSKYKKLNSSSIILYLISLLSAFLSGSSTALFCLLLIGLYILFNNLFLRTKFLNIKNYLIVYILTFFGIVIFRLQNLFKFLIVDILKRDLTFTGRIYIWDYVIDFIKQKPLIGYGMESTAIRYNKTALWKSFHAHNMLLEVLYKSGVVGLISFLMIVASSIKKVSTCSNNKIKSMVSWLLFSLFIILLTEAYSFAYIFYLFVIIYNVDKYCKEGK